MPENVTWAGVMPALTTPFRGGQESVVDHAFLARHAGWLVENGASGLVLLGSLGEGSSLSGAEKRAILGTCVDTVGRRAPIVAGIGALTTAGAVELARDAEQLGCRGLMVLPPYVYRGSWLETKAHLAAVLAATSLPCMLYNNPIAYGTDVLPEQICELAAEHDNLQAVKESSGDLRRITAIRSLVGDGLALFVGLDDMVLEGVAAGAAGWIAGVANALPKESVMLLELCLDGRQDEAFALYRWFLPLLRMDTVFDFVQRIKLLQCRVSMGPETVRPPRLPLRGASRQECLAVIETALANNPLA